jgi:hypothetical protein
LDKNFWEDHGFFGTVESYDEHKIWFEEYFEGCLLGELKGISMEITGKAECMLKFILKLKNFLGTIDNVISIKGNEGFLGSAGSEANILIPKSLDTASQRKMSLRLLKIPLVSDLTDNFNLTKGQSPNSTYRARPVLIPRQRPNTKRPKSTLADLTHRRSHNELPIKLYFKDPGHTIDSESLKETLPNSQSHKKVLNRTLSSRVNTTPCKDARFNDSLKYSNLLSNKKKDPLPLTGQIQSSDFDKPIGYTGIVGPEFEKQSRMVGGCYFKEKSPNGIRYQHEFKDKHKIFRGRVNSGERPSGLNNYFYQKKKKGQRSQLLTLRRITGCKEEREGLGVCGYYPE